MKGSTAWQEFFDGHAPQYLQNCFTRNTLAEVEFLIDALGLSAGASVLDVGCGTGRHAIELARRGYRVTGVDISSGMLDQARKAAAEAAVDVRWRQEDATSFVPGDLFDAVLCLCEGAFGLLGRGEDPIGQPLAILHRVEAALKPSAKCLFTVLNGFAMARRHSNDDVAKGIFDPLGLTELTDVQPRPLAGGGDMRERGFVPTELTLLFQTAGLRVLNLWGGTAGNWGRRPVDLDEMEIMVLADKAPDPGHADAAGAGG